jgi:hypothetical protein
VFKALSEYLSKGFPDRPGRRPAPKSVVQVVPTQRSTFAARPERLGERAAQIERKLREHLEMAAGGRRGLVILTDPSSFGCKQRAGHRRRLARREPALRQRTLNGVPGLISDDAVDLQPACLLEAHDGRLGLRTENGIFRELLTELV